MRRPTTLNLLALALAAAALSPAAATAGTVTDEGGTLVFRASPGETNTVSLNDEDGTVVISDGYDIAVAGGDCDGDVYNPGRVRCATGGGVRVELGDGDDMLNVGFNWPSTRPVTADGGAGNDKLVGDKAVDTLTGGEGDDTINGQQANDQIDGGSGNDTVEGEDGDDVVHGGDGNDTLRGNGKAIGRDVLDGGPGVDSIAETEYSASVSGGVQQAVTISLDGAANDGRPGEGDNIISVEHLHLLVAAELLAGGDPVDFQVFRTLAAPSHLAGSPGNDLLTGFDFDDKIEGGAGDDTIVGGYGNDTIVGGPGKDAINADTSAACNWFECRPPYGNDVVEARDGEVDNIDCGVGEDKAIVDPNDVVSASCETIDRGTSNGPGGPGKPGDSGKPGGPGKPTTKRCTVPRIKAGTTLVKAKRALAKAHCTKLKTRKVRSKKVRKGRVVSVSPKAGRHPKAGARVVVSISRGRR